jgi:hypothetical protein
MLDSLGSAVIVEIPSPADYPIEGELDSAHAEEIRKVLDTTV